MYNNIAGKLKTIATVTCIVGCAASVIGAFGLLSNGHSGGMGWIIIIVGPLLSWVSSLGMYALGEIIEENKRNRQTIARLLHILEALPELSDIPHMDAVEGEVTFDKDGMWTCPQCGAKNSKTESTCKNGDYFRGW